jgi:hypothetical protein
VRAPRANAIAARVVRPFRSDCFDHLIPFDERHPRTIPAEYVAYHTTERPHRSLGLEPPLTRARRTMGSLRARPVLGGLHHVYQRAA